MIQSNDLQNKQAYLRENVLEKGYDAEEFMTFLQMKKPDEGLDLNNWSMDELINAVNEFISDKNLEKEDDGEDNGNKNNLLDGENKNGVEQMEKLPPGQDKLDDKFSSIYDLNDEITKCQMTEITVISTKKSIKVKLSNPQKIDNGIFSRSFIQYTVKTEPFGYITNKRYSDFSWLRKMLSLIYCNCVIPPLCKKNYGDRFSDALIAKRMRSIEKFFRGIVEHPLLKNSDVLNQFLSINKKEEYINAVKKYEKINKAPTSVRQLKSLDGEIRIGITKEKVIYSDNIKNYAESNYNLLQKITKAYKGLNNAVNQYCNKMREISNLWKDVLKNSKKYYDSHNTSETFNIMSKLMDNFAEMQQKQMTIMNENIREYFRYVKNEFNVVKEMAVKVNNSKLAFTKAHEKLMSTKESLFEKQDLDAWQLKEIDKPNRIKLLGDKKLAFSKMLPQESMRVYELKSFYGGMLNSLINEFERIRRVNAKRHKEYITNFIRLISNECTNLHVCLADRLTEFHELKDDMYSIDGKIKLENIESEFVSQNTNLQENKIEEKDGKENIIEEKKVEENKGIESKNEDKGKDKK